MQMKMYFKHIKFYSSCGKNTHTQMFWINKQMKNTLVVCKTTQTERLTAEE